ncbi:MULTISPECIES: DMT family transporter [Shewanella]|uniref:DMT family transporter n=1 Tax=Shewanella TaxID=22 RepID=UPI00048FD03C|nr:MULTISPECIES: DMT family transporter [Shewanella]QLE86895.1 DMT family transporter [Shewanella sp. Scap07]
MNKPSNQHSGLIELHIAVLLFGGTALFSKLIALSALDITLIRCFIAAIVLALIVKLNRQPLKLKHWREYAVAIALGIVVSLHWVTYFASMQMSSVAIGMIAFFSYPVMTVLIEPIINRTRIEKVDIISGLAVLIGVTLLIPEASLGNEVTLGIAIGVLSALLFTARNLMHKRYFSQYSGAKAMCYQTAVAVVFLAPWQQVELASISNTTWAMLVLLGIVFTAAPHALFAAALRQLSAKTVGLVSCLQPFYGTVLALLVLHEGVDVKTALGGLLVVATAIFETQRAHKHQRPR